MVASTADDNVIQVWQVAYEQYYELWNNCIVLKIKNKIS
jgi:hypothetical protein